MSELLQVRNDMKARKPRFIRQDNFRRMRIKNQDKWRKPKGIHSKIRHAKKGFRKSPSPGYKSPAAVKGLHSTGLKMVHVSTLEQLAKVNKSSEGIIVSGTLGMQKKLELLKKAIEMKVEVLNFNAPGMVKKIEESFASRKQKSKKKAEKKGPKPESQKTEAKAEAKAEEKKENPQTHEEHKKIEKEEKNKVLTKKE
jgi:large subunit ribosomal protein L32e